jgi:hypothetical protein
MNAMRIRIQKGASVGVLLRYNMLRSILTIPSIAMADWFVATFLHPGLRPAVSSPLLSMRTDVMPMMLITRCTTNVLVVMTF